MCKEEQLKLKAIQAIRRASYRKVGEKLLCLDQRCVWRGTGKNGPVLCPFKGCLKSIPDRKEEKNE